MAETNDNQQQTDVSTQTNTDESTYSKLLNGEMSLEEVSGEQTTQEPANPAPEPKETDSTEATQQPEETLESYKAKSQQEIERLNKIAKDNQAEFTRRSQELSATKAELAELKAQLAQLQQAKTDIDDEELKALDDYPDDVKKIIKNLTLKNKALESQVANVNKFVQDEEGRRAKESEQQEHLRQLQQDFAENILPKLKEEEPDYETFMRANMQGYQQWAMNLSEGERFSFLNSKDYRDLLRGYREYKKFLNLPYEQEAIKKTQKENENKTGLYSTNASQKRQVAPKPGEPQLSEQEAYDLFIQKQAQEYSQRR